jgi:hypothetical protein
MYYLVLSSARLFRNLLRRLKRRLSPESFALAGQVEESILKKISEAFDHINLLQLVYVFVAVIFVPRHYVRRLPQITRGKHPLLPGSTQVVALTVTLIATVLLLMGKRIDKFLLLIIVLVAGFAAPLWAPIISVCVLIPAKLYRKSFLNIFLSNYTQLLAFNPDYLSVVLRCETYKRLDWKLYRWAMFYYVTHFLVCGALLAVITPFLFYDPDNTDAINIGIAIVLLLAQILLVKPYVDVVRSSLKIPLLQTYTADYGDLEMIIQNAHLSEPGSKKRERFERKARIGMRLFLARMRILEIRADKFSMLPVLLSERSSYALDLLGSREILVNDEDELVLHRLQLVVDGRSLRDEKCSLSTRSGDNGG